MKLLRLAHAPTQRHTHCIIGFKVFFPGNRGRRIYYAHSPCIWGRII